MNKSDQLGHLPIPRLLRQQAIPASIGILVMSIYGIVDTIFVGQFVGAIAIGAITVVLPITFLIASVGMAIGIGGGSIISRALGADKKGHATNTFGNQAMLTTTLAVSIVAASLLFQTPILQLFGGKGATLPAAQEYFQIIIYGIPFLAWAMMSNNVIRAVGEPRIAMISMLVPAVVNLILDPIFIIWLDMGLAGAAWATTISYFAAATFTSWFFFFGKSELRLSWGCLLPKPAIIKEIFSLGGVTLARQGVIAVLAIVLNNSLFAFGGELAMSTYGIIQRLMMFANFPVMGLTQGFLPITGYNYGAQNWDRVRRTVNLALKSGTIIAVSIFAGILAFTPALARLFTNDQQLINLAVPAIRMSFLATPLILFQLIGSAYFQAIGRAAPALLLTLTKQGFCLIPLILLLPPVWGLEGIWMAFPIADVLSAALCFFFLRRQLQKLGRQAQLAAQPVAAEVVDVEHLVNRNEG